MAKREDRVAGAAIGGFIFIWLISALLSLAFTGVVIWAIIELVQHFTAS